MGIYHGYCIGRTRYLLFAGKVLASAICFCSRRERRFFWLFCAVPGRRVHSLLFLQDVTVSDIVIYTEVALLSDKSHTFCLLCSYRRTPQMTSLYRTGEFDVAVDLSAGGRIIAIRNINPADACTCDSGICKHDILLPVSEAEELEIFWDNLARSELLFGPSNGPERVLPVPRYFAVCRSLGY